MKKYIKTTSTFKYKVFGKAHGIFIWRIAPIDYWIMYKGNPMFTKYDLTLII